MSLKVLLRQGLHGAPSATHNPAYQKVFALPMAVARYRPGLSAQGWLVCRSKRLDILTAAAAAAMQQGIAARRR